MKNYYDMSIKELFKEMEDVNIDIIDWIRLREMLISIILKEVNKK